MTDEMTVSTTEELPTALTLAELTGSLAVAPEGADDNDFKALAKTHSFLPRINLLQPTSKEAGRNKKGMPGDWLLTKSKDDSDNISEKFMAIPLAFRFKAVDMRNKEKILNYYDQKSPEFLAVKEVAKGKGMTGCMAGIEFLFWAPEQEAFATWYASSVTALGEAQSIRVMIGKPVWIKSVEISSKDFTWFGLKCTPCSEPYKEPDIAMAASTIKTFTTPKSSEVEAVTPEEAAESERAR